MLKIYIFIYLFIFFIRFFFGEGCRAEGQGSFVLERREKSYFGYSIKDTFPSHILFYPFSYMVIESCTN